MDAKYIKSLISLLDDPDTNVFNTVSEKIIMEGNEVIPVLENVWEKSTDPLLQSRIENIIDSIQYNYLAGEFQKWAQSQEMDLLQGTILVAKIQYPELNPSPIHEELEKIRRDIWLELNSSLTALEKVKIINHVIFTLHGYKPDTSNYFAPKNYFINTLIETKQGGPIILSLFYAIIAQKLGLPIYCVSLPHNFVLGFKDRYYQKTTDEPAEEKHSILFYINPFNQGSLFSAKEIELFLKQQKIDDELSYYLPCNNKEAILQLIYNASVALQRSNRQNKAILFTRIHDLLSK
ncbi:transglutaminase-like domain-containing protein [Tenuifilum osseticum]|uniref:transglutaminase-like domain-containing protein n=1 Tax=Tenuifilum osseticum TaxID=3374723 RepID=UPI0034E55780